LHRVAVIAAPGAAMTLKLCAREKGQVMSSAAERNIDRSISFSLFFSSLFLFLSEPCCFSEQLTTPSGWLLKFRTRGTTWSGKCPNRWWCSSTSPSSNRRQSGCLSTVHLHPGTQSQGQAQRSRLLGVELTKRDEHNRKRSISRDTERQTDETQTQSPAQNSSQDAPRPDSERGLVAVLSPRDRSSVIDIKSPHEQRALSSFYLLRTSIP
jgi:hypothetical protein